MTRRQVRAAMRRLKEANEEAEEEVGELNLVPYMDIVVNIIIFLLFSVAESVALGNINITLPTIGQGGVATEQKQEEEPLNLTVTLAANGIIVAGSGAVIPEIPKTPKGEYDYAALTAKLEEIKREVAPNETKAMFNADAHIPYDSVIQALDAMREGKDGRPLFPDITFAAGLL